VITGGKISNYKPAALLYQQRDLMSIVILCYIGVSFPAFCVIPALNSTMALLTFDFVAATLPLKK